MSIISPWTFAFLMWAIYFGRFLRDNPMLFGMRIGDHPSEKEFPIFRSHAVLDHILEQHAVELGEDYEAYRNHCLRVLSFAVYHLGGPDFVVKAETDLMAMALAYHDIALWTDGVLNYVDPSADVMDREMKSRRMKAKKVVVDEEEREDSEKEDGETDFDSLLDFSDVEIATAREIILQHHKYRHWTAPVEGSSSLVNERLVNAVRKGDWADATLGVFRYELTAEYLEAAYDALPEAGFHWMLLGMGGRLSPNSLLGQLDVLKILKW
jgi:hypothetical protein